MGDATQIGLALYGVFGIDERCGKWIDKLGSRFAAEHRLALIGRRTGGGGGERERGELPRACQQT